MEGRVDSSCISDPEHSAEIYVKFTNNEADSFGSIGIACNRCMLAAVTCLKRSIVPMRKGSTKAQQMGTACAHVHLSRF